MRKTIKAVMCLIVVSIILISGCKYEFYKPNIEVPKFQTQYTEQEHLDKIKTLTEERFRKEVWKESFVPIYEFYDCAVYMIYSFNDNPEYFLVELRYKEKVEENESARFQYKHLFGFIMNDEYYQYGAVHFERSQFAANNLLDNKKYYGINNSNGNVCLGYEKDGVIYGNEREWDDDNDLSIERVKILTDVVNYVEEIRLKYRFDKYYVKR